ncbi:hypothetical protein Ancab_034494 [Ancistrocladus abbreviatus]
MFAKLLNKLNPEHKAQETYQLNPYVVLHYGIPSTASRLAYDPIQCLLAIGTLDGRIKVIGGDNIEGLLISPKQLPFKHLEFLQNQGFLASISNDNDVQVWDLEHRCVASTLQWQSNIMAFSVIQGTSYMYVGDEYGSISVLKYDVEERRLFQLPYHIPAKSVSEAAGFSLLNCQSVVGVLQQPCSYGNRLLFAYDNGIIVLWDLSKNQLVHIKGDKDLHLKDKPIDISTNETVQEQQSEASMDERDDKEISSLCWASLDGSILAVGYVDGDIMLWNLTSITPTKDHKAEKSAVDVIKLQLSSSNKRFPVIVLHWSASRSTGDNGGQLFVYGGDEMGSAEVLTILNLEWSPGREALKNVARVDLTLSGSFADLILLQNFDSVEGTLTMSLLILTSPGQLQFYDESYLSALISQPQKPSPLPIQYSSVLPTTEPNLTAGRFCSLHGDTKSSIALSEMVEATRLQMASVASYKSSKWPMTGGVPSHMSLPQDRIQRLYIAGYQDGSVQIWDATYPIFSPLFILEPEVKGIAVNGTGASVSALDFAPLTLSIAVGSESGLICLYLLAGSSKESGLHVVTGTEKEARILDQGDGPHCCAVFLLCSSLVRTLRYSNLGDRLAVGFESGQVAMLDVSSLSVLFLTDISSGCNSPVISFALETFLDTSALKVSSEQSESGRTIEPEKEFVLALRSNLHITVLDAISGNIINTFPVDHNKESTAISIYILEDTKIVPEASEGKHLHLSSQDDEGKSETPQASALHVGSSAVVELNPLTEDANFCQRSVDFLILLSCTDVLQLYSLKSLIEGEGHLIHEVKLVKTCCWTATFKKDEEESALILLYQTGAVEIRSLPNLEVLGESSLMSILRWNFKSNVDKTISSTDSGHLALVNGCEFAVVSFLAGKDASRIQQLLPCLHDKVLAAAVDNDLNTSPSQKKHKETVSGLLGGLIKGFRTNKEAGIIDPIEAYKVDHASLRRIFLGSSEEHAAPAADTGEVIELSIDDIQIDEPVYVSPLPQKREKERKDKQKEREALFEGATTELKPKQRTIEEIKAKYRKPEDASAAAAQARNKLLERQEKLERLSKNSEELRSGAENFASLAQELAKRMENRKWWQL